MACQTEAKRLRFFMCQAYGRREEVVIGANDKEPATTLLGLD